MLIEHDYLDMRFEKYKIEYKLLLSNKRSIDPNNIYVVVDKYFQDALTQNKIIEDDNWLYNKGTNFLPAEQDLRLTSHMVEAVVTEV